MSEPFYFILKKELTLTRKHIKYLSDKNTGMGKYLSGFK